jgi:hypothetical protein
MAAKAIRQKERQGNKKSQGYFSWHFPPMGEF